MKESILTFFKGILMGICNVIPGVSAGTIAFITGIYPRLIAAIKSYNPARLKDFWSWIKKEPDAKERLKVLDLKFIITLGCGVVIAVLLGARFLKHLLETQFVYTMSLFIGLIIASCFEIFHEIHLPKKYWLWGVLGLIAGGALPFMISIEMEMTSFYVFISGFIAISTMLLPGISGSFVLLIMGSYDYLLGVASDPLNNVWHFIVFCIGAALGLMAISRVINWLFTHHKPRTLFFLLGLVLGSLTVPILKIINSPFEWNALSIVFLLILVFLGIISGYYISRLGKWKSTSSSKN